MPKAESLASLGRTVQADSRHRGMMIPSNYATTQSETRDSFFGKKLQGMEHPKNQRSVLTTVKNFIRRQQTGPGFRRNGGDTDDEGRDTVSNSPEASFQALKKSGKPV